MSLDDFGVVHIIQILFGRAVVDNLRFPSFLEEIPADAFTDQITKEIGKAHDTHGCRCGCNDYLALGSRMLVEMLLDQRGGSLSCQVAEPVPARYRIYGTDERFVFSDDVFSGFS